MGKYKKKRKIYNVTYEAVDPLLPEMQKKVDIAFDILFDAVLKEGSLPHLHSRLIRRKRPAQGKISTYRMSVDPIANPITLISTYARESRQQGRRKSGRSRSSSELSETSPASTDTR